MDSQCLCSPKDMMTMAVVDSYSPCPCGSGQKFKWCCHRAESYVDRALRLERNGQVEAALAAINDGIVKNPDVPLLLLRQAILLTVLGRDEEAVKSLDDLLAKHPAHPGGLELKLRLLLSRGAIHQAVDLFQDVQTQAVESGKPAPEQASTFLGAALYRAGMIPAALRHLQLPSDGTDRSRASRAELPKSILSQRSIPVWLKQPNPLLTCPKTADAETTRRFEEAANWAEAGLWRRAASSFELLSDDSQAGTAALVNVGLCRLWLADHAGASEAFRRAIAALGSSSEAVDLEALRQIVDPDVGDDPIEEVELSWPVREHAALLAKLEADAYCVPRPAPDAERETDVREFVLLDRPRIEEEGKTIEPTDLPLVVGEILVEADAVKLETLDDGRLNGLIDRFTTIAGQTIPPAHPRTRILGKTSRQLAMLEVACQPPPGLSFPAERQLIDGLAAGRVQERWPDVPQVALQGKTPTEAAAAGGFEVPLRAALLILESQANLKNLVDWKALRAKLNIPEEPAIDPLDVEIDDVPPSRLHRLDPHGLDDARLLLLHEQAAELGLNEALLRASREIASRRRLLERDGFPVVRIFSDLALDAAALGDRDAALEWIRKGRESEPAPRRSASAPAWDMLELQVRTILEGPEEWVPFTAEVMGRYEGNPQAMQIVLSRMVELGLIQLSPSPEDPSKYVADPSLLYSLLMRYGPRVQSVGGPASGPGGLWTPGSQGGGGGSGGGLWTPGSSPGDSAAPTEKKIIFPGR